MKKVLRCTFAGSYLDLRDTEDKLKEVIKKFYSGEYTPGHIMRDETGSWAVAVSHICSMHIIEEEDKK